jgi:hypothetical protein
MSDMGLGYGPGAEYIAGSTGRSAPPPLRTAAQERDNSAIRVELNSLARSTEHLTRLTGVLAERLQPVMNPAPFHGTGKREQEPAPVVPLAGELAEYRLRVELASVTLNTILQALEV